MDRDDFDESKCFTVTWRITNFSYSWQKHGEFIESPVFFTDTMGKNKWRLRLYPKGDSEGNKEFISFFLSREECKEGMNLDIYFELSLLANDDSVLISKGPYKNSFLKDKSWGFSKLEKREDVLKIRRKDYLPGNVLKARCRMWNNIQEEIEYGHCFAWTRIKVERRSFVWNIKQFSSFQESIYEIPSTSRALSMMKLKFSPSSEQNSKTFILEICPHDQLLKMTTFRIHLVDSSGTRTECLNDEISFHAGIKTKLFELNFSKEELMKNKNQYIPNDVLQLYCECDIATGFMLEEIKNISFSCPPSIQEGNLTSYELESTKILKENLESSYKENLLCDTKLKTKTGSFSAHKFILGARSPVFKAMFTNDMRGKSSECVDVKDLDDDTVQRMLLYLYTATVPNLQWDSACNLYIAADKYKILSLRSKCFSFLKDNLCPNNACDLLILAEKHQDEDLKSAIMDYILKRQKTFSVPVNGNSS